MKKITDYRKLLNVDKTADLKTLKSSYRNIMKECHPDKFVNDEEGRIEAEEKSTKIIEAYHFLISICPETIEQQLPIYQESIANSAITDYDWKSHVLEITFQDGSKYEYFGVTKNEYIKFINADSIGRFARRHIFYSYPYRNVLKTTEAPQ
ncbi:KTSC domain-containing protein [Sphingobacterium sp. UT-1RO-CII-1]|uniref:KTSC domain-containing protein n=1 Tax=Sphingobacterium sp. UT-1RO-CII-1 TaxID=2995225 RepID=UPI00227D61FA|nr:KTSC domain-containing protein [Sphingobacterium sp. UT-1RO-CII-1]MCY4781520.1 KTSC domain-containing protein [Sphingobacterium sp. UT-1RO-CII-1]